MIERMNALLKKLDKRLDLRPREGYYRNCKIVGINSYEQENGWTYFDANGSGAHITFHHCCYTDELVLYVDTHKVSSLDK